MFNLPQFNISPYIEEIKSSVIVVAMVGINGDHRLNLDVDWHPCRHGGHDRADLGAICHRGHVYCAGAYICLDAQTHATGQTRYYANRLSGRLYRNGDPPDRAAY